MLKAGGTASWGCWPDERRRLLLTAAVRRDERALEAWNRWRTVTTREQAGGEDAGLLAMAYRPLRELGADDEMLTIAGGLYRRNWYANQMGLQRAAGVLSALSEAGIEVMLLKGAALTVLHYRDFGARAMGDVDLLLRLRSLPNVLEVLDGLGWRLGRHQDGSGPLQYGVHVIGPKGGELDLHEYSLMHSADDSDLWEGSVELELKHARTRGPGPADLLLHVCLHGLRWHKGGQATWAADALTIIRSAGAELDWGRLVARARARRFTVALELALSWLKENLDAEVPDWVLDELRSGPRLRFEGALQRVTTRPHNRLSFALMSFDRYRRFARLAPPEDRPQSFIGFLGQAWGVENPAQLMVHGGRKLANR
jgi:hypothetical protein